MLIPTPVPTPSLDPVALQAAFEAAKAATVSANNSAMTYLIGYLAAMVVCLVLTWFWLDARARLHRIGRDYDATVRQAVLANSKRIAEEYLIEHGYKRMRDADRPMEVARVLKLARMAKDSSSPQEAAIALGKLIEAAEKL
jgi:hypothetical protein